MKKFLAIVFTFALTLSLAGCATFTALPEIENIPNKEVVDAPPTDNTLSQEKPTEQAQLPNQPDPETQPVVPVKPTQPETETKPTTPEKPTQPEPETKPITPDKPTVTPDPTTPTQSAQEPAPSESQPPAKKTKSEATAIALAHAKAAKSDVRDFDVELERDERIPHYDISFDYSNKEYEYEIDLYSGEILKSHVEADDKKPAKTPVKPTQPEPETQPVTPAEKTAGEAKAAALAHAKVQESSVRDFEVEKETERKQAFYEISFHAGGYDYEYKVDAITGKILHWEKEFDD